MVFQKFKLSLLICSTCLIVQTAMCQDTIKKDDNVLSNQEHMLAAWGVQPNVNETPLPTYFEKEETKGSPYLSQNWMRGILELSDHRRIPEINQYMFFNYDKYNSRLVLIDKQNKISFYPVDSISGFVLTDGDKTYSFEKIQSIGKDFLLESVLKSEKGFSLYKRIISRAVAASYVSFGYYSEGQKYDEFVDEYEYYLIYPDKVKFRKFYLNEKSIHKAFKDFPQQLKKSTNKNGQPATEKKLILLIEEIDNSSSHEKS
jgi:hypothetical protein